MASRGQQSAGPAGEGRFRHPGGGEGRRQPLPGWETGEGWAPPSPVSQPCSQLSCGRLQQLYTAGSQVPSLTDVATAGLAQSPADAPTPQEAPRDRTGRAAALPAGEGSQQTLLPAGVPVLSGWDRPPPVGISLLLKQPPAGPGPVRGKAPLTQPPPRLRLCTDQHSCRAGVGRWPCTGG